MKALVKLEKIGKEILNNIFYFINFSLYYKLLFVYERLSFIYISTSNLDLNKNTFSLLNTIIALLTINKSCNNIRNLLIFILPLVIVFL